MKLTVRDRFKDKDDEYLEIKIGKYEACCVKKTDDGELMYVLQCDDGNDVYSDIAGADFPLRKLSIKEHAEIMDFARKEMGE